jgi:hypothetical protein
MQDIASIRSQSEIPLVKHLPETMPMCNQMFKERESLAELAHMVKSNYGEILPEVVLYCSKGIFMLSRNRSMIINSIVYLLF